jgi:hypothetical protein
MTNENTLTMEITKINCPKHGVHPNYINSTIEGFEGLYCQLCWLETLNKCEVVTIKKVQND